MTELESAKFLALKQIEERWTKELKIEEKWELYRYLIKELQRRLPEDNKLGNADKGAGEWANEEVLVPGC